MPDLRRGVVLDAPQREKTRKKKPEPKDDPRMDPFLPRAEEKRPAAGAGRLSGLRREAGREPLRGQDRLRLDDQPESRSDLATAAKRSPRDFLEQSGAQLYIAHKCDYHLDWYFNSRSVAEYFQSLVEPPVKWKSYNCDTDSDHTW
jgi:hypothetical protein